VNDPFSSDPCLAYRHGSFLNDPFSSDPCLAYCRGSFSGGVLKSMLTLNEAIIDVKEG
jgi:hypothetical protein